MQKKNGGIDNLIMVGGALTIFGQTHFLIEFRMALPSNIKLTVCIDAGFEYIIFL